MNKNQKDAAFAKLQKLGQDYIFALIDNPYECPIIIDRNGIIRYMSRYSRKLINIDPQTAVGKHVRDVVKGTHLHEILKDGKARIGDTLLIAGRQQLISRIPLKDFDGKLIGAVGKGMLNEVTKFWKLQKKLELLDGQLQYYQDKISNLMGGPIIGRSGPIQSIRESARQAARTNSTILITGESGTGKEVVAYFIHQSSNRAKGPFIKVNCAAIPHELFESELFGYEEGAFTGASSKGKPGKFELAQGGTIFLDEIGEMPLHMQAKLLRVLQEKEIDRLGGTKPVRLDFRLIAATNRDLNELIKTERFRIDLFFRINIFNIQTPSLRQIREDIPLVAEHILSTLKAEIGWGPAGISDEAMDELKQYDWPGNVRELRNVLERAVIVAKEKTIQLDDLPDRLRRRGREKTAYTGSLAGRNLQEVLQETEKRVIVETLRSVNGNKTKAAQVLGIHRTSLYEKMNKLGIHVDEPVRDVRAD